jgi:hypothetical protein
VSRGTRLEGVDVGVPTSTGSVGPEGVGVEEEEFGNGRMQLAKNRTKITDEKRTE